MDMGDKAHYFGKIQTYFIIEQTITKYVLSLSLSSFRSSSQYSDRLVETGVAGEVLCSGDAHQHYGGREGEVWAVLARVR